MNQSNDQTPEKSHDEPVPAFHFTSRLHSPSNWPRSSHNFESVSSFTSTNQNYKLENVSVDAVLIVIVAE